MSDLKLSALVWFGAAAVVVGLAALLLHVMDVPPSWFVEVPHER